MVDSSAYTLLDQQQGGLTDSQKDAIARRRRKVDMAYGQGTYDQAVGKVKPHRCARHLDDALMSIQHLEFLKGMGTFVSCLFSETGKEPIRIYNDSPMFDHVRELGRLEAQSKKDP
ncbi:hypothetical protein BDV3_002251 [Batrachochytrium dendrobatidis]|nr:hypothetical protein O5D80_001287 [Batrachochytrium dendrobatidis]KAK5664556.1 hypothetical protein QVD99_008619 [Batrachochytrium dendrobatidis]